MKPDLSSHFPTEVLERRAAEQRARIHNSVTELKSSVRETIRGGLDVEGYARKRVWPLLGLSCLVAAVAGYGAAGIFTRY